jgi:hypothetical protein
MFRFKFGFPVGWTEFPAWNFRRSFLFPPCEQRIPFNFDISEIQAFSQISFKIVLVEREDRLFAFSNLPQSDHVMQMIITLIRQSEYQQSWPFSAFIFLPGKPGFHFFSVQEGA